MERLHADILNCKSNPHFACMCMQLQKHKMLGVQSSFHCHIEIMFLHLFNHEIYAAYSKSLNVLDFRLHRKRVNFSYA